MSPPTLFNSDPYTISSGQHGARCFGVEQARCTLRPGSWLRPPSQTLRPLIKTGLFLMPRAAQGQNTSPKAPRGDRLLRSGLPDLSDPFGLLPCTLTVTTPGCCGLNSCLSTWVQIHREKHIRRIRYPDEPPVSGPHPPDRYKLH